MCLRNGLASLRSSGRASAGGLFPVVALVVAAFVTPGLHAGEKIVFNRDIRPILSEKCFACHGPDQKQRKADLRLDLVDEAIKDEVIVVGKPEESEFVARVDSEDPDEMMPPPHSNKTLTPVEKELLRRWIAEGAVAQGHWAYEMPVKPRVAADANPIDDLVKKRLATLGTEPSPEVDRRTLARRLYFDLRGLPPKPDEVAAFVDDASPDAYEKLVERLLASPQYGERMAIAWLDLVRYADTIGYHSDTPRNVWPYRDYVIGAFNQNMPFDRFTVEQLAGDLLPDATREQQVASCFNRLLLTTEEGGAQPKDYEARMLTDRVRAVGTVWLGQTFGCCQCHDHKFDPIATRDFYALGAFFADIQEPIIGAREPGMTLPDPAQAEEVARLQAALADAQRQLTAPSPALAAGQEAWEKGVLAELSAAGRWTALEPAKAISEHGARLAIREGGIVAATRGSRDGIDTYRLTIETSLKGITGLRLDALLPDKANASGPGQSSRGNFVLTEFSVADAAGEAVALAHASATFEQSGFPAFAAIDGKVEKGNGWAVAGPTGETGADQAVVFETGTPLGDGTPMTLTLTLRQEHGDKNTLGRFRVSATTAAKPIRAPAAVVPRGEIVESLRIDPAKRDAAQRDRVTTYYRQVAPELYELRARPKAAQKALAAYEAGLSRCLVSTSMSTPRTVRILPRGNWMDETGEVVTPALPGYLAGSRESGDRRLTRLDLARWIVARENPLTARVFMNRLWKQFFGIGLSKSIDDLGSQGEWPVHPELLDWLASEFVDRGWDVKQMVRTIVTSRTYRQASTASKEWLARDPANRNLARQSRFRLDAEMVRDNALAISGLLVAKVGGPSVKPYQPEGYWENLNFPVRKYQADTGADQYRRGLYTWWQRSFLHPSMLAFDAPTREECAADRSRSNIPQQALVLLNDPTFVEAARVFAARILKEGGAEDSAQIAWAWQEALQCPPRDGDINELGALLDKLRSHYAQDRKAAESLLEVGLAPRPEGVDPGELAAWTNVARVILNLHETITRN